MSIFEAPGFNTSDSGDQSRSPYDVAFEHTMHLVEGKAHGASDLYFAVEDNMDRSDESTTRLYRNAAVIGDIMIAQISEIIGQDGQVQVVPELETKKEIGNKVRLHRNNL